ncbi:3D domain-containing protein [Clostridium prolinivorans]|uniref:3D domain-containing protein n=1 Tax=Clostridium prolinivorans TaxID=2769420 RepID=UPI002B052619|nr:3D domain-containing protein [Clostridium prolinivorans]
MKKLLSIFIVTIILFSTSPVNVFADNPKNSLVESKIRFQQINNDIMNTNKEISLLNSQIDKLKKEIKINNENIEKNNKLIEAQKKNMENLEKEVNETQETANKRLRAMYINSYSESFFTLLMSSENFADLLDRIESIKRIVLLDKKILNELEEKRKVLNKAIENLNTKKQELENLQKSNEENLAKINEDKIKLEELILKYEKEKAAAAQLIKENEEKLISHAVHIIDSSSSSIDDIKNAIYTLNSLIPQISTISVKNKAQSYVSLGNKKLNSMLEEAKKKAEAEKASVTTSQNVSPSRGNTGSYKATYTMTATAYTGGTLTAMGLKPIRNPNSLSTIAVDPSFIPLGSKVYIPGYGYAIASDTGSAIKGNIIDLYMNSEEECINWGRRPVTLHIVAYPGEW